MKIFYNLNIPTVLTYINLEMSRVDNLGDFFKWDSKKIQAKYSGSFWRRNSIPENEHHFIN